LDGKRFIEGIVKVSVVELFISKMIRGLIKQEL
jgi:hypothetical protein